MDAAGYDGHDVATVQRYHFHEQHHFAVAGFVIPADVFAGVSGHVALDAVPDVTVEQLPHAPDFVVHGQVHAVHAALYAYVSLGFETDLDGSVFRLSQTLREFPALQVSGKYRHYLLLFPQLQLSQPGRIDHGSQHHY